MASSSSEGERKNMEVSISLEVSRGFGRITLVGRATGNIPWDPIEEKLSGGGMEPRDGSCIEISVVLLVTFSGSDGTLAGASIASNSLFTAQRSGLLRVEEYPLSFQTPGAICKKRSSSCTFSKVAERWSFSMCSLICSNQRKSFLQFGILQNEVRLRPGYQQRVELTHTDKSASCVTSIPTLQLDEVLPC